MVVDEGQRRPLHQRLAEVLGVDQADVLMEHLPPSGWGDVARRSDLDHLEGVLRSDMRAEMALLRADLTGAMAKLSRTVIVGMAAMVVSLVGSFAVAALTLHR